MANFYGRKSNNNYALWNEQILLATNRVYKKLKQVDFAALGVSDYNNRYINEHLNDFEKTSWFISHLFILVFEKGKNLNEATFVDYGGGSGIISYVALELGFKSVIYNDIFETSCTDVSLICNALEYSIDHFVCGDAKVLAQHCAARNLAIDFVVAQDVIEHIYNVNQWYLDLKSMLNPNSHLICTSHANKYNALISRKLKKQQKKVELIDRDKVWGAKERDSLQSYLKIREQIIRDYLPELEDNIIKELSISTRGLIKEDIIAALDFFKKNKQLNYQPNHSTNTCDPLTGNWIEQLIDLKSLKQFLELNGYNTRLSAGFYIDTKGSALVKRLKLLVNIIISNSGFSGFRLAPYYIIDTQLK